MASKKYKPMPDISSEESFISKTFENIDFREAKGFNRCLFYDCVFDNCNFEGVHFYDCVFKGCVFDNCNLKKTYWWDIYMQDNALKESSLIHSTFDLPHIISTEFYRCSLRFSKFKDFEFFRVSFDGSLLYYALFISGVFESSAIDPTTYCDDISKGFDLVTRPYKSVIFDHIDFYNSVFKHIDFNKIHAKYCSFNNVAEFEFCKNVPYVPMTCPEEGSFIAYKKIYRTRFGCSSKDEIIAVLEIPADAKRSSGGRIRKCRCSKAKVLRFEDMNGNVLNEITEGYSSFDRDFVYRVGEYVMAYQFDENRWKPCSTGIHFFINRQEAINYDFR